MIVAIALGSNLGDRRAHLEFAVARLSEFVTGLRVSGFLVTEPVAMEAGAPTFLNAAAVGETTASPSALLERLQAVEIERGRERPFPNAPRTLDLDLVLYADRIVHEPGLVVPHPRFRERRFVLQPLAEIAPGLVDPISGRTVAQLLDALPAGS